MGVFDDDTALVRDGGTWRGQVSPRWHIGRGVNGGFVSTLPLRAMLDVSPHPEPLSMTTHYLQRPVYGPVEVRPRLLHATKGHAYLAAEAVQEHGVVLAALAITGTIRDVAGPTLYGRMPETAPPEEQATMPDQDDPSLEFTRRFEYRAPRPEFEAFFPATPDDASVVQGWMRLRDRDLDALAVPTFMDGMPPAAWGALGPGLTPTVELTVHWRSRPRTRWHLARFSTRFFTGGYVEEDGELWGEDGRLVAMSRQLARYSPLEPPS
ncbi:MAG TPA: thioesterase family protein [Acidimicrobiales bacterium]|nr:thioesterase family protein [Acidimicrobiales bacterium]